MEAPAESVNPEHGLPEGFGEGLTGRLLFWIAVSFSTFQIITAFGIPLDQPFIGGLKPHASLGRRHGGLGGCG